MDKPWLKTFEKYGLTNDIQLPPEDTSLIDIFEQNAKKFGSRAAFVFRGSTLTFNQLDDYSRRFAAYLQSLQLKKGARIAVMMPNIFQYPVVAMGIFRAGMILVNVNPLYTARELEHQLNDAGADVLIIVENFAHVYQNIVNKTTVKHVIVTGVGDMLGMIKGTIVNFVLRHVRKDIKPWHIPGHIRFNDTLNDVPSSKYKRPKITLSDTAVLQYTGGTTGVAKGAELTHRNIIANMLQVDVIFSTECGTETVPEKYYMICALPLYHIFSFTVCAMYGMYRGITNVLIPNPRDLDSVVSELAKYPPVIFPAVNTLFNALIHNEAFRQLDHSRLKICIGGGMAVLPSTAAEWQKVTGTTLIEGYGLSETSPLVSVNPLRNKNFTGTIGLPAPSTEIILLDENDQIVAQGESGEIAVRGPQVMRGYWNRADETAKVMTKDGFFRTGDIGFMNEEGYFKIVDRKKDMILVSGFNVYPNEVEEVIAHYPKVLEVAVIGVPDEKSGEVPKAFIVKKDPALTADEILAYTKQHLTGYKRPRYVEFIDELPKSNIGKILRKELR